MHSASINPIFSRLQCVFIAVRSMKQLNTSFGIAGLGSPLIINILSSWNFLSSLCGTFWPNNLLHCDWILDQFPYCFHLLPSLDIQYDSDAFTRDVHSLYLDIRIQCYQASQVLRQVPVTPIQQHFSSCVSISSSRSALDSPFILDTP